MEMTRRNFLAGATGVAAASTLAVAAENLVVETDSALAAEPPAGFEDYSAGIASRGGSTMSIEELNAHRREILEAATEYVDPETGEVVPEVYVKLRALVATYSFGLGEVESARSFDFFRYKFTEEEAQAWIDMPMGVLFTAQDWAQESGRSEAECLEMCDRLAERGALWRAIRGGMHYFHQIPVMHGMAEYSQNEYDDPDFWTNYAPLKGQDFKAALMTSGTPFYRPLPPDASVVKDGDAMLPLDDWRAIIERNDIIAVCPCQCRRGRMLLGVYGEMPNPPASCDPAAVDFETPDGHPYETCTAFGEEAEYYISLGIARQITKEEAVSIFERSVDAGMVIESMFTRDSEIICHCHGDCCTILSAYKALGPEFAATASCFDNLTDYSLEYDPADCIKCGACAQRCPMEAITIDGEDGQPQTNALCVSCGQCGLVCPVEARKLALKPEDERPVIPATALDDYNQLAAYRIDHDML